MRQKSTLSSITPMQLKIMMMLLFFFIIQIYRKKAVTANGYRSFRSFKFIKIAKKNSYRSTNVCQKRPLAGYMLRCLGTIQFAAHAAASQNVFADVSLPPAIFLIIFKTSKLCLLVIHSHSRSCWGSCLWFRDVCDCAFCSKESSCNRSSVLQG